MKNLIIYFPYYNQPNALKFNLEHYSTFKESTRKRFTIFIVDDGSQDDALKYIEKKYLSKLNIILYRIDIDIKWNQPEANNLAFLKIDTEHVLRTDIDHFFYEKNLIKLLNKNLNLKNNYYKFMRKDENNKLRSPPNIYIISKKNYMRSGGYNESLSGNYGDDFDFLPRIDKIVKPILLEDIIINVNGNFSTRGLIRDATINRNKLKDPKLPHLMFQHKDKYILKLKNIIY